jgi:hypothetical protein
VQNYRIKPDFDLFSKGKNGGPGARVRWTTSGRRCTGPRWTRGRSAAGARPSGRSGAPRLAAEAREASRRHGDPSGGLTSDGGGVRRTSNGGERSSAAVIGVERLGAWIGGKERRGERGVERRRRVAFYRTGRRWRGGEEVDGGGKLIPIGFE